MSSLKDSSSNSGQMDRWTDEYHSSRTINNIYIYIYIYSIHTQYTQSLIPRYIYSICTWYTQKACMHRHAAQDNT